MRNPVATSMVGEDFVVDRLVEALHMDDSRFDRMARQFGAHATRRSVLRLLLGTVATGAATTVTPALATPRRRVVCRNPGHACTRDAQCCTGLCRRISGPSRSSRY